jgi:phosphodiesterase/alkaline phosphatase D-like protein
MQKLLLVVFSTITLNVFAQNIVVKPYLQNAEPTSMHVMWETSTAGASEVQYGTTTALGTTVQATIATGSGISRICDAHLTGLQPATKYYYKAVTNVTESSTYHFITPPLKSSEASFNIVAMSDMQQEWQHTSVFKDLVEDNLIPYMQQEYGSDLAEHLGYFIVPGDLVQTGGVYSSWASTFFVLFLEIMKETHLLFSSISIFR